MTGGVAEKDLAQNSLLLGGHNLQNISAVKSYKKLQTLQIPIIFILQMIIINVLSTLL